MNLTKLECFLVLVDYKNEYQRRTQQKNNAMKELKNQIFFFFTNVKILLLLHCLL